MRIQEDIRRTIARRTDAFPVSSAVVLAVAVVVAAGAGCRGGCRRPADPAATVQGRLALFPEPTRVLVSLDVAKLRASAQAGKLAALTQASPQDQRTLEDFARRTGLNPLEHLDNLLVGFPEDARTQGELGLVLRAQSLDEPRLVSYVRDQLQKQGDDLVGTPHGRFTLWSARRSPDVAGFFVDAHTFVLGAGGWAPRMAALAETARPGDSAATNIDLKRLVERAGDHALWAAAIVPAASRRKLQADPSLRSAAAVTNLVVGVDFAHGMQALAVADVETEPDARALAMRMQETLRDAKRNAQVLMLGLGPYLDGVSARAVDRRFELRATLTEPQVDDLIQRLAAFLALMRQGRAPGFP
jgi:hypothetical protein